MEIKKIKKLLLTVILVILFIPFITNAETCPKVVSTVTVPDQKYKLHDQVTVRYNFANIYTSLKLNLEYNDKTYKFIDIKVKDNYKIDYDKKDKTIDITRKNFDNSTGYVDLTLEIIGLENTNISFSKPKATCEDKSKSTGDDANKSLIILPPPTLDAIFIGEGTFSESFNPNKFDYTLTLNETITTINVGVAPTYQHLTVSGDLGDINITNKNQLKIFVTDNIQTYTYTVNLKKEKVVNKTYEEYVKDQQIKDDDKKEPGKNNQEETKPNKKEETNSIEKDTNTNKNKIILISVAILLLIFIPTIIFSIIKKKKNLLVISLIVLGILLLVSSIIYII